jgi:hypothetical protein
MNSFGTDPALLARTVAGLEAWLGGVAAPSGGLGGPAIGLRGASLMYCGEGFDWRVEAMLEARGALFAATGETRHLDGIAAELERLAGAQLLDGKFRNSWFDANPFEGGMPHEPAVLAAGFRALRVLEKAGRKPPPAFLPAAERYLFGHLLKCLWNPSLHTVRDWEITDFERYSAASAAAAVELMVEWVRRCGEFADWEYHVRSAARSILALQDSRGALDGAVRPSNVGRDAASPFLAARCLPALRLSAAHLRDDAFRASADRLAAWLARQALAGGGFPRLVHMRRPPSLRPVLTGAVAGLLHEMRRAGDADEGRLAPHLAWLAAQRMPTGALRNGDGFGRVWRTPARPDWRDVLPVQAWQAMALALLAPFAAKGAAAKVAAVERMPVTVGLRRARYSEDASRISVEREDGRPVYLWRKGSDWAEVCEP